MRASPLDRKHSLADDQHPDVKTIVWDELLNVQHATELRQHAKRSAGKRLILQAGDSTPLGTKHRFNDNVAAERLESRHCSVRRLADDCPRHSQARGCHSRQGKVLVDGRFDRFRRIDHRHAGGIQSRQGVHAKHNLLERAGRHCADEHGVGSR